MPPESRRAPRPFRVSLELLEDRRLPTTMVSLTAQNHLVRFDSSSPNHPYGEVAISGLIPNETILAIDGRPATGQLVGLGTSGRLYALDPTTGAAAALFSKPIGVPLIGHDFSIDFDPTSDEVRLISDSNENVRINPSTGDVITDAGFGFNNSDPNAPTAPFLVGEAYANNLADAATTTLYAIDARTGSLVTVGDVNGVPLPPVVGVLNSVGPLGVATGISGGFDITADGQAFAAFNPSNGIPSFASINLATGVATTIGAFSKYSPIVDIAALDVGPSSPAPPPVVPPIPTAAPQPLPPRLVSTEAVVTGVGITGIDLQWGGMIDPSVVQRASTYTVAATAPGKQASSSAVSFAVVNLGTGRVRLAFDAPLSLAAMASVKVFAHPTATGGPGTTATLDIRQGRTVRYQDRNGDGVILAVSGKGASLVVIQAPGADAQTVVVRGSARVVTGRVVAQRGTDHGTTIGRVLAGGARVRFSKSIQVGGFA